MTTLFRAKPRFVQLLCFASVVGVCGGAVAGVFGSLKFFFSGQWEEGFLVLFLAPVAQTIQFTVLAAVSFPLFSLWCRRFGGPKLEGELEMEPER